ncbi:hypothetical protein JCM3770_003418 [Rhodotorula araucariae]
MAAERDPLPYRREPDLKSKQVVVILNLEGDLFDTALIAQGEEGGKIAASEVHRIVLEEMAKDTPDAVDVAVYLVACDKSEGEHVERTPYECFLDGFKASPRLSMVVNPIDTKRGGTHRVLQLLWFHLPTVTRVFLGSNHRNYGAIYIEKLDAADRAKITLVETVVLSRAMRKLIDSGQYSSTESFQRLCSDKRYGIGLGIPASEWLLPPEEHKDNESIASTARSEGGHVSPKPLRTPLRVGVKQSSYPLAVVPDGPFRTPKLRLNKPVPCYYFYLAKCGCFNGDHCHASHDYHFFPCEWKAYPLFVKSMPCTHLRDSGMCRWGEDCVFGHRCPYTVDGCPYGERCRFAMAGLPHAVGPVYVSGSKGKWRRGEVGSRVEGF